jgi:hypothetical protein
MMTVAPLAKHYTAALGYADGLFLVLRNACFKISVAV